MSTSTLIVKYDFENNVTNKIDNTTYSGSLSASGTSYVAGKVGQGISLDGSTGFVELPRNLILNNNDFTISFWFNTNQKNMPLLGYQNVDFNGSPTQWMPIAGIDNNGKLNTALWTGSSRFLTTSTAAVNDGAWHQIVITAHTSTTPKILTTYLDGAKVAEGTSPVDHLQMAYNYLGYTYSSGYYTNYYYTGLVDEFEFYSDALTASEVASSASAPAFQFANISSDRTKIILTYDELLSSTTAAASAFVVTVGGAVTAVASVAVVGRTVELTFSGALPTGQAISVAYSDPTTTNDTNAIQDAAGNDAASLPAFTLDVAPPTFVSATTSRDGTKLILTYSEALSTTTASASDFLINGASGKVTAVAVSGRTIELTLLNPIQNGGSVTVSYADPTNGDDINAIQDIAGNDVTSLNATTVNEAIPPAFVSAATSNDGTKIILTLDEDISATTAVTSSFTARVAGVNRAVTSVSVSGKTVELTLSSAIQNGQSVSIAYSDPTSGNDTNAIQDLAGNDASSLPTTSVSNIVPDVTAPVFVSAATSNNGSKVILTYSEALSATTAATTAFTVTQGGSNGTVTGVAVSGNTIQLTLGTSVLDGQVVTVAYTDPTNGDDANAIQDAAGNDAITIAAQNVTNIVDTTAPNASLTTASIKATGNAIVQSNEIGTAYLVRNTVNVTGLSAITSAANADWNQVTISVANTATNLAATGLNDGIYKLYTVDTAGNLSLASTNSVKIDNTPPSPNTSGSSPADNATSVSVSSDIVVAFSEPLDASSNLAKIYLKNVANGQLIPSTITLNASGNILIKPTSNLDYTTSYYVTWEANALKDAAGNIASAVSDNTTYNFNTEAAPAPAPPSDPGPAPAPTPIANQNPNSKIAVGLFDGVDVTSSTKALPNGRTLILENVPIVTDTRQDDPGTKSSKHADIPLALASDNTTLLEVSVPSNIGLISESFAENGGVRMTLRDQLIAASDPRVADATQMTRIIDRGIDQYVSTVSNADQVTVRTITPNVAPGLTIAPSQPIIITGASGTGESDAGHPYRQEALVIDVRNLPAGSVVQLDRVEFAVIVGQAKITGGEGRNYVVGDGANQYIMLGPEDDILRGGGGDDTVGSAGGDDKIFGDDGNDTLFGGSGHNQIHGGTGNDVVTYTGSIKDYIITRDRGMTYISSTVDPELKDTIINAESIHFSDQDYAIVNSTPMVQIATLYQQVLGRQADLAGFQGWAGAAEAGYSMGAIAISFINSAEKSDKAHFSFKQLSVEGQVDALYHYILGRDGDAAGKAGWVAEINKGAGIEVVAGAFVQSAEFNALSLTPNQWDFMV